MSSAKFGTDGIRGVANSELTPELALQVGISFGRWVMTQPGPKSAVIGRDTRTSGEMLEGALAAGLMSAGLEVVKLGVAPTPAVSFAVRNSGYGGGLVVSASHNPAPDNGIKLFGPDGAKLPDAAEGEVENGLGDTPAKRPVAGDVGKLRSRSSDLNAYCNFLINLVPEGLAGMRIALDAAHGAAYEIAPRVLKALGADVEPVGVNPTGININDEGGATKPDVICQLTKGMSADFGVAFDGDADRAVFSDSEGRLVNGDATMGIWAAYHQELGELKPSSVVGTVMSNGGFEAHLKGLGITLLRTPVGDKYVSRELATSKSLLGGEQSGHIVFPRLAPSGDGLMTTLELLRVIRRSGKPLSEWSQSYSPWPQLLLNLTVASPGAWQKSEEVRRAIECGESELAGRGRVNVRASGTQPILRVMVEADSYALRDSVADTILSAASQFLGATVYSRVDLTHALGD